MRKKLKHLWGFFLSRKKTRLHFANLDVVACFGFQCGLTHCRRYCNCDMICDINENDHFYITVLIFTEKHIKMILVLVLEGSLPNKFVFLNELQTSFL